MELLDHVEVFYRLVGPEPLVVRVNPGSAAMIEERLRPSTHALHVRHRAGRAAGHQERRVPRHAGDLAPTCGSSPTTTARWSRSRCATSTASSRSASSSGRDKLDEAALEDLLKFVLGETNGFLRRAPLAGFKARREAVNGNAPGALAQRV